MAIKSDKMKKVISETERLDAAVESLGERIADTADLFETLVTRFGTLSELAGKVQAKIPQG